MVSALVIPNVTKNYNDKKYNTARLKALKTFGEAGKMASINEEINGQPTARDFVKNVLSKYLKIVKVCDTAAECNFPSKIQPLNSSANKFVSDNLGSWNSLSSIITSFNNLTDISNNNLSVYVMTTDGFSAKIFYNPKCVRNSRENPRSCPVKGIECETNIVDDACLNVIYDMNEIKSPNHVGDDIAFVTVFWSGLNTLSFAPGILPYNINSSPPSKSYIEAQKYCAQKGTKGVLYTLPNMYEAASLVLNKELLSMPSIYLWTGSVDDSYYDPNAPHQHSYGWGIWNGGGGVLTQTGLGNGRAAYCVRR